MNNLYDKYFNKPSIRDARKRRSTDTPRFSYQPQSHLGALGAGKTYLIQTYGCQGNEADTETMQGILHEMGFSPVHEPSKADLIILNTCAIRANAENRVFGEIGRLKQFKRHNPDLLLAVAGCMPQEESVVEKLLKSYPYVDLIFGTHNIHKLPYYLESAILSKERVIEVFSEEGAIIENLPKARDHAYKAWVNIMYGCDEFCTYCIVPYTRGKERSRAPEDVLEEIRALASEGYREVTLLGQNVNAYVRDFTDRDYTFAHLLADLRDVPIDRIRFTTSHPKDLDEATILVLAQGGNLMPHIHLPVQSGSNAVLKKMNRHYTREVFLQCVDTIRTHIPDASLTTDLIVGFPTETDADFDATLDLVKTVGFEGAFTFIFSPRDGTPAAQYVDDVPAEVKKTRLQTLNQAINAGYLAGHKRFEGQTVKVLVDGQSKSDPTILAGYTPHNKLVNFSGPAELKGQIVDVKITEAKTWFLKGTVI